MSFCNFLLNIKSMALGIFKVILKKLQNDISQNHADMAMTECSYYISELICDRGID